MKKILLVALLIIAILLIVVYIRRRQPPPPPSVTSNSWIMQKPTVEDEKPKLDYGRRQWWAWYGYTYTEDRENELLLNANIYPRDGTLYGHSYTLDGDMYTFNFEMDINWDEKTNTLYGTFKRERDEAVGTWTLNFPKDGYRVYEQKVQDETLKIEMWERGIPLWGARTEDEMLQVGWADGAPVYGRGFHDNVYIKATLTRGARTRVFNGWGLYARVCLSKQTTHGEAVVGFVNEQPEFYIAFAYVRNAFDLSEVFVKQGRIGFSDKAYRFDDFTYSGDKYPDLKWFKIKGIYEDGKVDLIGDTIGFLHYRQMHPLIHWKGTITRNGETVIVDSLGSGEFRQLEEPVK